MSAAVIIKTIMLMQDVQNTGTRVLNFNPSIRYHLEEGFCQGFFLVSKVATCYTVALGLFMRFLNINLHLDFIRFTCMRIKIVHIWTKYGEKPRGLIDTQSGRGHCSDLKSSHLKHCKMWKGK